METEKIGMREFRETLGFYVPAQKKSRKAEVDAMPAATSYS